MNNLYRTADLMEVRAPRLPIFAGECRLFKDGEEVRRRYTKDVIQYVWQSEYRGIKFDEFSVGEGDRMTKLPVICGVYFLFRKNTIVYVGQSTHVYKRVFSHGKSSNKIFDSFSVVEFDYDEIDLDSLRRLESAYILKFLPEYNVGVPPTHIWERNMFEIGDEVLTRQKFYLLAKDARVNGSHDSHYDVRTLRERFLAKRAPVYRPVFSTDEQKRFDELGGIRAVIAAGMAALGVTAETGE